MDRATILICDDNPSVILSLTGYLEAEKMNVVSARSGEEALEAIRRGDADLVILDIMLPGMSGIEVCREIKKISHIPVIMLSAKGEEIDRIIGLEMGADDYVTKPFSSREVVIRVKKLLSRTGTEAFVQPEEIKAGRLRIYPESFEVFQDKEPLSLTAREFRLLCYLAENAGRTRSRDQIISEIWGTEFEGESRVVDILINRLRNKVQNTEKLHTGVNIVTVFGIGYRLEETDEEK